MILLTGATGAVGYELAKIFASGGMAAKAVVRSSLAAEKLAALSGIEPVTGDFDDEASLDAALVGIERVFLLTNSTEKAEAQQLAFVAAAKRAGVKHIVKLSQLHAAADSPVRFLRYHAAVEHSIRESGMDYTFLRPNLFMQGLLGFKDTIAQGQLFAPIGTSKVSLVDIRDIAAVAFEALTTPDHVGRSYDITGPEALSHPEIAARIGTAIGATVAFIEIPPAAMLDAVLQVGFLPWQAEGLIEDYAHYARGEAEAVSPDAPAVIGRPARDFDAFLDDYKAVFSGPLGAGK